MLRAATTTLLAAALFAGCGSAPDRAAQPTGARSAPSPAVHAAPLATKAIKPALTHRAFVAAMNRSCRIAGRSADGLERDFQAAMNRSALPEAAVIYERMGRHLQAHVARVQELEPPARDVKAVRRYLSAESRLAGLGRRMVKAMKADDLPTLTRLSRLFAPESDRRLTAAIDMGAEKCGG